MAIPAFHFSGVYRNQILSGEKCASLMYGEYSYPIDSTVLLYISDTPNLFDEGSIEKREGIVKINENKVLHLKEINLEQSKKCGYRSIDELEGAMKEWFPEIDENSLITYVEFEFI